jgi:hypothetical protein
MSSNGVPLGGIGEFGVNEEKKNLVYTDETPSEWTI